MGLLLLFPSAACRQEPLPPDHPPGTLARDFSLPLPLFAADSPWKQP